MAETALERFRRAIGEAAHEFLLKAGEFPAESDALAAKAAAAWKGYAPEIRAGWRTLAREDPEAWAALVDAGLTAEARACGVRGQPTA